MRDGQGAWLAGLLAGTRDRIDLLVVAGDITENGRLAEADAAAELLAGCEVPVLAVLGNHDQRGLRRRAFRSALEDAGVRVLDGDGVVLETRDGARIGIAGVAGCGGGFWRDEHLAAPHGRAFRAVAVRVRREAERLDQALGALDAPIKIAVTHFAPTTSTLGLEPAAKWWMLGNRELGEVVDAHRVDLAIHGHAHLGFPSGRTARGIPVRNVALPVTGGIVVERLWPRSPTQAAP